MSPRRSRQERTGESAATDCRPRLRVGYLPPQDPARHVKLARKSKLPGPHNSTERKGMPEFDKKTRVVDVAQGHGQARSPVLPSLAAIRGAENRGSHPAGGAPRRALHPPHPRRTRGEGGASGRKRGSSAHPLVFRLGPNPPPGRRAEASVWPAPGARPAAPARPPAHGPAGWGSGTPALGPPEEAPSGPGESPVSPSPRQAVGPRLSWTRTHWRRCRPRRQRTSALSILENFRQITSNPSPGGKAGPERALGRTRTPNGPRRKSPAPPACPAPAARSPRPQRPAHSRARESPRSAQRRRPRPPHGPGVVRAPRSCSARPG